MNAASNELIKTIFINGDKNELQKYKISVVAPLSLDYRSHVQNTPWFQVTGSL